jgi:autotransporter-associated beta strand protein
MMRGSTVVIRPGATGGVDNVVTFNGTIGDDSRESYVGAPNGKGFGAGLTIGKGLTIFNGRNTYTGQTTMEGGVLKADNGWGLNTSSNLNFNGAGRTGGTDDTSLADNTYAGVLMTSGYFSRQLGTDGTKVQWTGSGGFAASGGDLVVNLGNQSNSNVLNPQQLKWGVTPGFFTAGGVPVADAALVFGSQHADSVVRWINPIDLGALSRQVVVADNAASDGDFAVMEGALSGAGGLIVGEAGSSFWNGKLVLTGQNSFTGDIDVRSGTLAVAGNGTLATGVDIDIAEDASFIVMAADLELGLVDNAGALTVGEDVKALGIHNTGSVLMAADIDLSPGFPFASDDPANYNGDFFNDGLDTLLWVATSPGGDGAHTLTVDQFRGTGTVRLGALPQPGADAPILTIAQRGESTFDGVIEGAGGLTLTAPAGAVDPASKLTLTNTNTYEGPTAIAAGSTLALKDNGSIAQSASVQVDGTFDITGVTTTASVGTAGPQGTKINDLGGGATGKVLLGDKLLIVDKAASDFAGVISGDGDLAIARGEQTLSGFNLYTGETYVLDDATLKLAGAGSIADSARVVVTGELDISQTDSGASIKGLEGNVDTAKVTLGDERLTITGADPAAYPDGTSFAGIISGTGGVSVTGGTQTLANANTYTGTTIIGPDGELDLVGSGGIAASESVTVDGIFDITGTTTGAEIIRLLGTDPTAQILLGSKLLALTGDGASAYAGTIAGDAASGLAIQDGTLVLTGPSPGFLGTATIESDAALRLAGAGSVTGATIDLAGLFDISGITAGGTSVADLSGTGEIDLGHKTLAVTDATGGTFSGPLTGDGAFGVAGGLLNLDFTGNPTVNANIFAATGGKVGLTGGTIDTTASDQPALSVINGGSIDVTNTKLVTGAAHPAASVLFDDGFDVANNPAHIALGTGTVLQNEGRLLEVTRDNTGGTGNAFAGDVHFIIDNASVVVGDILDPDAQRQPDGTHLAGVGSTTVYLGSGVDWTGRAVAGDFLVKAGAGAHFAAGSLLDNLTAESGALVNILTGNLNVLGKLTLNSNGIVAPGASPGTFNIGSLDANDASNPMWIRFGKADPLPGMGNDYSQINVQGDFSGTLKVSLERYDSDQSTPLGNLDPIELIRIGGDENGSIVLAKRFVQNGHELLLDRKVRPVDPAALVVGDPPGGVDEDQYFNFNPLTDPVVAPPPYTDDQIIVYGLKKIVQDESFGLATLTGTLHQAGFDTLGTYIERRGSGTPQASWMRVGANHTEADGGIANVQDIGFVQFGADLVRADELRAGVIGSYTASNSTIDTDTGAAGLQGNLWAGGAYATWTNGSAYVDAVGQYGYSDWTFSPTAASSLTINGHTALTALEAGVRIGDDELSVTPWSQLVWQGTLFEGLDSAWVGAADFAGNQSLNIRGGLRAEGRLGAFAPYLDLSVSHDVNDRKTVSVDGFDITTGMGGTRVELGTGFEASVSDSMELWTQLKGAYGVGAGDALAYQGRAGLRASW